MSFVSSTQGLIRAGGITGQGGLRLRNDCSATFYYADSCNFNIQDDRRMGAHFNGMREGVN